MRPLKIAILHPKFDSSFRVRCHTPLMWLKGQRAIEMVPATKVWEADMSCCCTADGNRTPWPSSQN